MFNKEYTKKAAAFVVVDAFLKVVAVSLNKN